jgi:hypothetical protein
MSEIKPVIAIVANPSRPGDLGQCAEGHYVVANGILTMTDADGKPLRDDNTGRRVELKLLPGDDERAMAKRLTLKQVISASDSAQTRAVRACPHHARWRAFERLPSRLHGSCQQWHLQAP